MDLDNFTPVDVLFPRHRYPGYGEWNTRHGSYRNGETSKITVNYNVVAHDSSRMLFSINGNYLRI